ncbi:MAG: hypothetical protein M9950_07890 [Thermomicrobiales bacterium]|nr:hypothetical protein [Thermomicrobiales bacterium]
MISAPDTLLKALADEHRRVASQWRSLILLRRATNLLSVDERRWINTPSSTEDIVKLYRRMVHSKQIESIPTAPGCYAVTTPYADRLPLRERELLFELNPYATISHYSALEYHSFTYDQPKIMTVSTGKVSAGRILGTMQDEWESLDLPTAYRPRQIITSKVRWFNKTTDQTFGIIEGRDGSVPIRVSDQERTLIESLQWPEYSGGIANVIRAWAIAEDFIDINKIVEYTERFDIKVLTQRVGFVAEEIGFRHPRFEEWAAKSARGGSNKLLGSAESGDSFSHRWRLSINVPVEAYLHI